MQLYGVLIARTYIYLFIFFISKRSHEAGESSKIVVTLHHKLFLTTLADNDHRLLGSEVGLDLRREMENVMNKKHLNIFLFIFIKIKLIINNRRKFATLLD